MLEISLKLEKGNEVSIFIGYANCKFRIYILHPEHVMAVIILSRPHLGLVLIAPGSEPDIFK